MGDQLKELLTSMRNAHLKHAADLKMLADNGVTLSVIGETTTIKDMIKRECDAAHGLQETITRMS